MTYAQNGEDDLVAAHFGGFVGRFLDLGAHNGRTFSNTLLLAERGWSGVWLDASYRSAPELVAAAARLPGVEVVHGAISADEHALVPFWDCPDSLLSTARAELQEQGGPRAGAPKLWLPTLTVYDLLRALPGPYHVISVDLEGLSLDVLRKLPLLQLDCRCICVEVMPQLMVGIDEAMNVRYLLEPLGFRLLATTAENVIMVRP